MLNYRRFGQGRPVVLIHGFLGAAGYWQPVVTALPDTFDLIIVELPGFGGSANHTSPSSLSGHAALVFDILDALNVQVASMIGFSMGGMIAQQAVLDCPKRIASLVLYGTSAAGSLPDRFESWDTSIERIQTQGVEATADRTVASWFVKGTEDPYYPTCREACRGASLQQCVTVMRAMKHWSSIERLSEMQAPTLILVGDKDRSTKPAESIMLWKKIAGAELCVLPNAAHGAHMEKPALFSSIVADFLLRSG
jgi:pimeloyl-ACP methyl ester carboxylesterase